MIFCTKHGCLSLLGLLSENSTDLGAQTTDTYFSQSGGWSPGSRCLLTWSLVRPFSWLGDVCLLSVATCSERRQREGERERGGERDRTNSLMSVLTRALIPSWAPPPGTHLTLVTSQSPTPLQTPSRWRLGFQHTDLLGTHFVLNKVLLCNTRSEISLSR